MIAWIATFISIISLSFTAPALAQTPPGPEAGQIPTFHMTGDVGLLSNYINRGLTYTDQDPALQGSFWFNFGSQFRLGVWGSNVNFADESTHFNLHLNADIRVVFSPNSNLTLRFTDEQYFDSSLRRGRITGIVLNTFNLKTTIETLTNWEGTGEGATYYNFRYKWEFNPAFYTEASLGYSQVKSADFSSYFDGGGYINYKGGQILWMTGLTYAAEESLGRGGLQFVLGAKTEF